MLNFYCGRWQCKTCGPRMTEKEIAESKRRQAEIMRMLEERRAQPQSEGQK